MTLFEPIDAQTRACFSGRREDALASLAAFVPKAGRAYAGRRNYDYGPLAEPAVSRLSPWIRHRVISEDEVVGKVLDQHALGEADKFIQEVCWRTYWRGWLEQRPSVWWDYLSDVERARERIDGAPVLRRRYEEALAGTTGIACFDAWVRELVETGYVHNHARMWFASIWTFTLKLPWVLGADFFLRHLLDGDPASNTLSWRWVAGLHTAGKTYLARPDNIETYTAGRFRPVAGQLADVAEALADERAARPRAPLRDLTALPGDGPAILLVTEDDVSAAQWPLGPAEIAGVAVAEAPSGLPVSPVVAGFRHDVLEHAGRELSVAFRVEAVHIGTGEELIAYACAKGARQIVTHYRPAGFMTAATDPWMTACTEAGLSAVEVTRAWDRAFWPHAKAGFFQLKDRIPSVLRTLGHL